MMSIAWRSSGDSVSCLDSCDSRSSAMKSLATDAIPTSWALPFASIWPVTRSSTATEMVAPSAAAASVACAMRAGNPSNAARQLGGDFTAAWTAGCRAGSRVRRTPLPRSRSSTPPALAAVAHQQQSCGARPLRVVILRRCHVYHLAHVTAGLGVQRRFAVISLRGRSGTIDQLSPAVVGRRPAPACCETHPDARNHRLGCLPTRSQR